MANMSYCRFENTLADLRDCEEAMSNLHSHQDVGQLSETEYDALIALIRLCRNIADENDWIIED